MLRRSVEGKAERESCEQDVKFCRKALRRHEVSR